MTDTPRATQPVHGPLDSVAVIGAGISGLACALVLHDAGVAVTVFEKSRGAGGRAATRRVESAGGALQFDHGAQYFTARHPAFRARLDAWRAEGTAQRWEGRVRVLDRGAISAPDGPVPDRWVGVPGMSALGRALAGPLDVRYATRVAAVTRAAGRWRLTTEAGDALGEFAGLVVAIPAPQVVPLLADAAPAVARAAAGVEMTPCWSAMLALARPLELGFDAAFVGGRRSVPAGSLAAQGARPAPTRPLAWVARDASKPHRAAAGVDSWVLHASAAWSTANLSATPEQAADALTREFALECGATVRPAFAGAHRWRFAAPRAPLAAACLFDAATRAGACGDWCGGPRVEGAYLSGLALADRMLGGRAG